MVWRTTKFDLTEFCKLWTKSQAESSSNLLLPVNFFHLPHETRAGVTDEGERPENFHCVGAGMGDAVKMTRGNVQLPGKVITQRRGETGKAVECPMHPALEPHLLALPSPAKTRRRRSHRRWPRRKSAGATACPASSRPSWRRLAWTMAASKSGAKRARRAGAARSVRLRSTACDTVS